MISTPGKLSHLFRTGMVALVAFTILSAPLHVVVAAPGGSPNSGSKNTGPSSNTQSVKAAKPTAPKISITSPKARATVSGTQTITVSVSDAQGVTNVQYKLDGKNLGNPVTAAPYSFSWDTKTATNASHSLTAVATNTAKLSTTSAAVRVTVKNTAPTPPPPPPVTTTPVNPPVNTSLSPAARISFTFDDGLASTFNSAMPTLAKYGLTGTVYVTTGCIGMTTAPNTCRANTDTPYMSWDQVATMQNNGWEIGSHTATHPYLATSDASDGQPNVLTPQQVIQELTQSKAVLAAHGINATSFASPYGDYNMGVLAEIAKYYASQRGFADQNNNDWPAYNDYIVNDYHVEGTTTVAQVQAKIDDAIANNRWLVLTFHDIKANASTDPDDYEWSTAKLDQVAAYVKAKQTAGALQPINVNQGLVTSSTNLLPNGSFNSGIGEGWTTDAPANITADSGNNGSYPDPTNAVELTSLPSGEGHLFSPKVAVTPGTTYILKNFLNVKSIGSGSVGFYVDEYDSSGNWISGQYKKAEPSAYVESMNFSYTPSSGNVKSASLQIIVGGTGIVAYVDNVQWFPSGLPATPPPAPVNLMPNGTFDNGLGDGWATDDPANITPDAAGNGSPANPVNSVKLSANAGNKHLFSPKVAVDYTKNYSLAGYLKLQANTNGEIGFYIDEYDSSGNWISGQWKTGVSAVGAGDVNFVYTPSSANVKSASLQIIVVGNSGVTAYIDHIRWTQN